MMQLLPGGTRSKVAFVTVLAVALVTGPMALGGSDLVETQEASTQSIGEPRGVHLSWTEDEQTTTTITWFTDGVEDPGSTVAWGTSPDALDQTVEGEVTGQAPGVDVLVHEATITGLDPGTTYHYSVVGDNDVFSFTTAPEPSEDSFSFVWCGDNGTSDSADRVIDEIVANEDPAFFMIAGDTSYADGDQPEWDEWFDVREPFFANKHVMTAVGNHEVEGTFGTEPYQQRFALPGEELYYSFDYANVHVLVLNSDQTSQATDGSMPDQLVFAEEDLADAAERRDAGEIDHIFVIQHHPIYSNVEQGKATRWVEETALWEEQLFHRYGVDALFAGHNHHYERTFPMAYQAPTTFDMSEYQDPAGWIEVISGGCGRSLYDFKHPDDFLPYSATHERRHHYVEVTVDGPTYEITAISADLVGGDVIDHFTVTKTGSASLSSQVLEQAPRGASGPSTLASTR